MIKKLAHFLFLKVLGNYQTIDGWLTKQEAWGLFITALKVPSNSIVVEIGSWQGKSTYCLARGLRSGKIYAIDPFNADAGFDEGSAVNYKESQGNNNLLNKFIGNMTRLKVIDKIKPMPGYSYDFADQFAKINFLFIDGDHSIKGCQQDFEMYAPKVAVGGYIAFHDYYADRDELGPTYVIKNLVLKSNEFVFYGQYDSLWIAKKIA
jgi:predicted O-methyltransferase YrrM